MATWNTYGWVKISAGIAVIGSLWFARDDRFMRGEDIAGINNGVIQRLYAMQFGAGEDLTGVYTQGVFMARADLQYARDQLRAMAFGSGDKGGGMSVHWLDPAWDGEVESDGGFIRVTQYNTTIFAHHTALTPTTYGDTRRTYYSSNVVHEITAATQTLNTRSDGAGNGSYYMDIGAADSVAKTYFPTISRGVVNPPSVSDSITFEAWSGEDNWWKYAMTTNTPYMFPSAEYVAGGELKASVFRRRDYLDEIYLLQTNMTRTIAFLPAWGSTYTNAATTGTRYFASYAKTESKADDTGYDSLTIFSTTTRNAMAAILATNTSATVYGFPHFGLIAEVDADYHAWTAPGSGGATKSRYDVEGEITLRKYTGIVLPYPSSEAIATGLVSRIRVYALYGATPDAVISDFTVFPVATGFSVTTPSVAGLPGGTVPARDLGLDGGVNWPLTGATGGPTGGNLTVSAEGYVDVWGGMTGSDVDFFVPIGRPLLTRIKDVSNPTTRPSINIGEGINLAILRRRQRQIYGYTVTGDGTRSHEQVRSRYRLYVRGFVVIVDWTFPLVDG